jgi:hypothetical protein
MTSHQYKRIDRQQQIHNMLRNWETKLKALPYYEGVITAMDANLDELNAMGIKQSSKKSYSTNHKATLRQDLEDNILSVANAIAAYAFFEEIDELLRKTSFSDSELSKYPQHKLVITGRNIYNLANELPDKLKGYSLQAEEVEMLGAVLDSYLGIMHKPKMHKADYEFATNRINELLRESSLLLKKSDRLVKVLRFKEPVLYSQYRDLRRWVKTGYRHIALKGQAIDALTGRGLQGVNFTFKPADAQTSIVVRGKTFAKLEHLSGARGGFMVKRLARGTYECTVSCAGYLTQTIKVYVNKGKMLRVRVALERE